MGKNLKKAIKSKKIVVEESKCERCGRQFQSRDIRQGKKLLILHLQREHGVANPNVTSHGVIQTQITATNSTGIVPWGEAADVNTNNPNNQNNPL